MSMLDNALLSRIASAVKSGANRDITDFRAAVGLTSPQYQSLKREVKALAADPDYPHASAMGQLLALFPARGTTGYFPDLGNGAGEESLDSIVARSPSVAKFVDAIAKTPEANRKASTIAKTLGMDAKQYQKVRSEFASLAPIASRELKGRYKVIRGRRKGAAAQKDIVTGLQSIADVLAASAPTSAPASAPAKRK